MSVCIRIAQKGVFDQEGNRVPVGTVMELPKEPKGWANKYVLVSAPEPEEGQELETGKTQESAGQDVLEPLRERYRELTGNEPDKRWGYPKLTAEIAELEAEEDED